ncbi:MAG: leucine-rich repeat domain-containing protein [Bacteroidota bacterium]
MIRHLYSLLLLLPVLSTGILHGQYTARISTCYCFFPSTKWGITDYYYYSEKFLDNPSEITALSISFRSCPRDWSRLENLKHLELNDWEEIRDSVDFYALPKLVSLDISGTDSQCLPPSLGALPNLQALSISNRSMVYLPAELGKLMELRELNFWRCNHLDWDSAFQVLSKLSKLEALSISSCDLKKIPTSLSGLKSLKCLSISSNPNFDFQSLVDAAQFIPNLIHLDVEGNDLTDMPNSIHQISSLRSLNLSNNALTKLSAGLGSMYQLSCLDVSNNNFSNSTPLDALSGLSALTYLEVRDCQLTSIPNSIYGLVSLTSLDISQNPLGDIPMPERKLPNLQHIYLENCQLNAIPTIIYQLPTLRTLSLGDNAISNLDKKLLDFKQLKYLYLEGNSLKKIPNWVLDIEKLDQLHVKGNPGTLKFIKKNLHPLSTKFLTDLEDILFWDFGITPERSRVG